MISIKVNILRKPLAFAKVHIMDGDHEVNTGVIRSEMTSHVGFVEARLKSAHIPLPVTLEWVTEENGVQLFKRVDRIG